MKHHIPEDILLRVSQMERYLDTLQAAVAENPAAIRQDETLRELLETLTEYYDGGQWLRDYTCDEMGLLPGDLKRGVLAEDTVYNFLAQIREDTHEEAV